MPVLIENGKKIMSMEVKGKQFIDSLNYFTTALANLPKIFGLEELHKGYFPHLFSTPENQEYSGEVPAISYYDPDGMKPDRKNAFEEWWRKQMTFDFQADLERYCVSDVDILRRCCGHFRSMFMEHMSVDPFNKSFIIASVCNRVYRTLFLQPLPDRHHPPAGLRDQQPVHHRSLLDGLVHPAGRTLHLPCLQWA